ncbi:MAG: cellulose synthase catalytic subunit, partial [Microcoleus sp. C1-bin4]|nr:cellulose synthase catalytic subunit [Microcoleus sp. C1-bin4]
MTTSIFNLQELKRRFLRISRVPAATLVVLGAVAFAGAIAGAWFAGEGTVSGIFATINTWQQNPPVGLQVPATRKMYLLVPTVVLVSVALAAIKIS